MNGITFSNKILTDWFEEIAGDNTVENALHLLEEYESSYIVSDEWNSLSDPERNRFILYMAIYLNDLYTGVGG